MSVESSQRRLFITEGTQHFQIFSFSQNKNDGSIYVSSPSFSEVKWLTLSRVASGRPSMTISDSPSEGKLSLHGSGEAHVRSHNSPGDHRLLVSGNLLKDNINSTLGVRHLFTVLIAKPEHLPNSPAFNRVSDYTMHAQRLAPYVMIFWAVPAIRKLSVQVSAAFNADDLETVPPESGWGSFGLALHSVVWFAYRTKYMQRWPAHPHICYHDGYLVPVIIGIQEGGSRLELRTPKYELSETELRVAI